MNSLSAEATSVKALSSVRRAPSFKRTEFINTSRSAGWTPYYSSSRSSRELTEITDRLINGEGEADWKKELNKILSCPFAGKEQSYALMVLFCRWAERDFQSALECAAKINVDSFLFTSEIFSQLIARDPGKALMYYENNSTLLGYNALYISGKIARNWAIRAPDEALDWCFSIKDDMIGESLVLISFMRGLGFEDMRTRSYIDKIYAGKGFVPSQIITEWAADDPDAVVEWGKCIKEKNPYYTESVLAGVTRNDANKGKKMWSELSEDERSRFSDIIVDNMGDHHEALSWVVEVNPLSQIDEFSLSRVRNWAWESPDDAESWIRGLPSSGAKDIAIEFFVENVPRSQTYETVMQLVNSVTFRKKKEELLKIVHQKWTNNGQERE